MKLKEVIKILKDLENQGYSEAECKVNGDFIGSDDLSIHIYGAKIIFHSEKDSLIIKPPELLKRIS